MRKTKESDPAHAPGHRKLRPTEDEVKPKVSGQPTRDDLTERNASPERRILKRH